ncbi:MAG: hemerythrin family protein [Opitutae bacterium]|nr:hemerythrin family protein [Opitutae bacterium]
MTDWSERFETGDPQIDADHREFFLRIEALKAAFAAGAPTNRAAELLQLLHEHALAHFQREELAMARAGCGAHIENCTAHREFARKLDGWTQLLCLSGPTPSLVEDIHRESAAWMRHHILRVDCRLRGCLAAKTNRIATAADA